MSDNNTRQNAPRKQLSDQLDRLDTIIDALDVALAEAVRDAVANAVQEAVRTVIRELMSNPEVLRVLASAAQGQPPVGQPAPPQPPAAPAKTVASRARTWLKSAWSRTAAALACCLAWALATLPDATQRVRQVGQFLWKHRIITGASLAVGLLLGVLGYLCGPTVSSAALCGTATSAVAFVTLPFTNLWARLTRRQT